MREYALQLAASQTGFNAKLNALREYLQAYILRVLFEDRLFDYCAFVGGTALRFLHGLPRFSEDLDFSLTGEKMYILKNGVARIQEELVLAGYDVSIKYSEAKIVRYASIGFAGLMNEAGISPHRGQKLSIKIEIDTRPPAGAGLARKVSSVYFPVALVAYDLGSLFAGKTSALLTRKYTKGRDYFDLGWYLSRWKDLSPNIAFLGNALRQTGWEGPLPSEKDWRKRLGDKVKSAAWEKVRADVGPFLERSNDLDVFSRDNILSLLEVPS